VGKNRMRAALADNPDSSPRNRAWAGAPRLVAEVNDFLRPITLAGPAAPSPGPGQLDVGHVGSSVPFSPLVQMQ